MRSRPIRPAPTGSSRAGSAAAVTATARGFRSSWLLSEPPGASAGSSGSALGGRNLKLAVYTLHEAEAMSLTAGGLKTVDRRVAGGVAPPGSERRKQARALHGHRRGRRSTGTLRRIRRQRPLACIREGRGNARSPGCWPSATASSSRRLRCPLGELSPAGLRNGSPGIQARVVYANVQAPLSKTH